MPPKEDNYESLEYELEPFRDILTARLEQIDRLVGVSSYAMRSMHGMTDLHEAMRDVDPKRHQRTDLDTEEINSKIARVQKIEEAALAEASADFPLLHSSATVLAWGALEASIKGLVSRWLETNPDARQIEELNRVKVKVGIYESYPVDRRMSYLVNILDQELGGAKKPGIGRFHSLLKPFGLAPKRNEEISNHLNEMAAVRNVVVHRAGIIDERFRELCPDYDAQVGDAISLGREDWLKYRGAIGGYAAAILRHVGEKMAAAGA